jgi:hypothetical protein
MAEASQGSKENLKCILHVGEDDSCEPVKTFLAELFQQEKVLPTNFVLLPTLKTSLFL